MKKTLQNTHESCPRPPFLAPSRWRLAAGLAFVCALAFSSGQAWATSATWTGASDATWSLSDNWSGSPTTVPGTGDTATFSNAGNGNTNLDLGGGVTIKAVLFDTAGAAGYTIGSGGVNNQALTLNDSGTVTVNPTVASNELFDATLTLGTATAAFYTFTESSTAKTLAFAGNIQGGALGTAGAKTLTIITAGDMRISGIIANGGASSLALTMTNLGAGTLTLSGANTYSGATTINNGALHIDAGAGGSLYGTSPYSALTFRGAGTFNYDNTTASGSMSQNMGALTSPAGEGTVQLTRTAAQTVALTFSSLGARSVGAARNFVYGGTPGTLGTDSIITLSGAAAGYIDQGSFCGGSAYAWNNDVSPSYVRAIAYGSDSGAVTSSGDISLASATHQQITGAITAQNTATFTTLNISGNHDFTLADAQTVTVNGILKSGNVAGGATISGGTGIQAASGAELVIRPDGANDALTISSPILVNGSAKLTKSGAGTLTLSVANAYTGGTYLVGGTLKLGNVAAMGANVNNAVQLNGGTLDLATDSSVTRYAFPNVGGNVTILSDRATPGPGITHTMGALNMYVNCRLNVAAGANVDANSPYGLAFPDKFYHNSPAGVILDVANNGTGVGTLTLGPLGYNYNITKQGSGTLLLPTASTRTSGTTTITAGTLKLGNVKALGTTANNAMQLNGGTLDLATDASVTGYNTLVGGDVTIQSDKATASSAGITHTLGTLSIRACNLTVVGGGNVNSGTAGLIFGATTFTGDPTFTINNPPGGGATLLTLGMVVNLTNLVTFKGNGNFAQSSWWGDGPGGLSLDATYSGTVTLSQANTFSGPVTVNGGTLLVNGSLGAGSAVAVAANATVGGSGTISDRVSLSAGGMLAPGGINTVGTLTIGGTLAFDPYARATFDLSDSTSSGNDQVWMTGGGTVAANGATITINPLAPLAAADYVLFDVQGSGSVSSAFNATPAWQGSQPAYAGHYSIITSNNIGSGLPQVLLHYSATAAPTAVTSFGIASTGAGTNTISYAGGSGSQFVLLRSFNVTAPAGAWARIATNTTTPNTFTIPIGTDPAAFYRVRSE